MVRSSLFSTVAASVWKGLLPAILALALTPAYPQAPYADLRWRNIGPANMMGRIAAIDAIDTDYRQVLVATASGGVYQSTNAGITWQIIFDNYGACSIGSVALCQGNPEVIWVGTGEAANRNSSGWGNGLFKSSDGGKTFQYAGLASTHHIAGIAPHPTDPDICYVAAVGHLWGYSGERGLYKTTDGGKNWVKLSKGLPDDGKTGCTDIKMHPRNPNILYAGFYQRLRQPFHYQSGGPNGGIFKSTDGGKSWKKLTTGLPGGPTGMIDISIHRANPDILVATVEADERLPGPGALDPAGKPVAGTGVYRSDDGGKTWRYLLKHAVRPFYHGQIEIDPVDPNNIYVVGRDFRISRDGGKTFFERRWRTDGGDDHDLWIAPHDPRIMYLATDQGLRLTLDGGRTILSFNNMAIGQYYAINVDRRDPYWVIGGLQDNGLWMGPSNSRETRGILNEHNTWVGEGDGFYCAVDPTDYRTVYIVNHVGFAARLNFETRDHVYITPTPETTVNFPDYADPMYPDSAIRYTIDPGEHWFFGEYTGRPKLPPQFRFNWNSPLALSPSNPRTLYFGGNHLFKSVDRGDTWRIISPDLTRNDPDRRNPSNSGYLTRSVTGGENHYTIVTVGESPCDPAVVWAGCDDGNLQVTRDGGASWINVKPNVTGVPAEAWVSRVEPSHFDAATCYVSFDNHRYDDFQPYVFRTTDYGRTWTDLSQGLPKGWSVYVIREDPVSPDLLFAGIENGVHVSTDGGQSWAPLMSNLPTVAVYDLVIHPRDGDLIAGTHGRSIWILDDLSPLRQLTTEVRDQELHLFDGRTATKWKSIFTGRKQPHFYFRGENPRPGAYLNFYLKNEPRDSARITVAEPTGVYQTTFSALAHAGINRVYWNFNFPPTEAEQAAFRQHLEAVITTLEARVQRDDHRQRLADMRMLWQKAQDLEALNDLHDLLTEHFAVYARGKPFFGNRLEPRVAPAGVYQVTVQVDGNSAAGTVRVREDPLVIGDW